MPLKAVLSAWDAVLWQLGWSARAGGVFSRKQPTSGSSRSPAFLGGRQVPPLTLTEVATVDIEASKEGDQGDCGGQRPDPSIGRVPSLESRGLLHSWAFLGSSRGQDRAQPKLRGGHDALLRRSPGPWTALDQAPLQGFRVLLHLQRSTG